MKQLFNGTDFLKMNKETQFHLPTLVTKKKKIAINKGNKVTDTNMNCVMG